MKLCEAKIKEKLMLIKTSVLPDPDLFFKLKSGRIWIFKYYFFFMCRLWVSNLECSTHRVLNVVIGTPKPTSRRDFKFYVVFLKNRLINFNYLVQLISKKCYIFVEYFVKKTQCYCLNILIFI